MYYAEIKEYDIANGPGVRLSFFVSGCTHHCRGCFNEMTWDFHYGTPYTKETEDHILDLLSDSAYTGMTLLGGEPMEPVNQRALLPLVKRFRERYPEKTLWIFTGYLYDRDLLGRMWDTVPETKEILSRTDVLVDGEFMEEKKDITLLYKGSSNQRTIDVQKSLKAGTIVGWDPGEVSMSKTAHL
ncbi:MAG: anaerobic ribonucleoside-triphosphate reductase activating protein [Lachnospiraceae bacterium]|jgi:anaerobic ribonucleoside-triphosphate reductase activating protein|nr:anaerobic ribonucleoside-triphosphate reductase activating protein [Lachnospiraceae bacterium]MCI1327817.1 anaerobic ribonucleoside-triphosphate reductase activating protein [Lachnospiraceae bacterium]